VLYAADSALGTVWRVSLKSGGRTAWATGAALRPGTGPAASGFGVNGLRLHHDAVWVSNTDAGTLLRIPVRRDGSAGPIGTRAKGLAGIDDFGFAERHGDTVLAALNTANQVALVRPNGTHTVVLTRDDGLSNPTSVAVRGRTAYVTSAAYFTQQDPNLLLARVGGRAR
jgi:sugar lactone lactonase YvrE